MSCSYQTTGLYVILAYLSLVKAFHYHLNFGASTNNKAQTNVDNIASNLRQLSNLGFRWEAKEVKQLSQPIYLHHADFAYHPQQSLAQTLNDITETHLTSVNDAVENSINNEAYYGGNLSGDQNAIHNQITHVNDMFEQRNNNNMKETPKVGLTRSTHSDRNVQNVNEIWSTGQVLSGKEDPNLNFDINGVSKNTRNRPNKVSDDKDYLQHLNITDNSTLSNNNFQKVPNVTIYRREPHDSIIALDSKGEKIKSKHLDARSRNNMDTLRSVVVKNKTKYKTSDHIIVQHPLRKTDPHVLPVHEYVANSDVEIQREPKVQLDTPNSMFKIKNQTITQNSVSKVTESKDGIKDLKPTKRITKVESKNSNKTIIEEKSMNSKKINKIAKELSKNSIKTNEKTKDDTKNSKVKSSKKEMNNTRDDFKKARKTVKNPTYDSRNSKKTKSYTKENLKVPKATKTTIQTTTDDSNNAQKTIKNAKFDSKISKKPIRSITDNFNKSKRTIKIATNDPKNSKKADKHTKEDSKNSKNPQIIKTSDTKNSKKITKDVNSKNTKSYTKENIKVPKATKTTIQITTDDSKNVQKTIKNAKVDSKISKKPIRSTTDDFNKSKRTIKIATNDPKNSKKADKHTKEDSKNSKNTQVIKTSDTKNSKKITKDVNSKKSKSYTKENLKVPKATKTTIQITTDDSKNVQKTIKNAKVDSKISKKPIRSTTDDFNKSKRTIKIATNDPKNSKKADKHTKEDSKNSKNTQVIRTSDTKNSKKITKDVNEDWKIDKNVKDNVQNSSKAIKSATDDFKNSANEIQTTKKSSKKKSSGSFKVNLPQLTHPFPFDSKFYDKVWAKTGKTPQMETLSIDNIIAIPLSEMKKHALIGRSNESLVTTAVPDTLKRKTFSPLGANVITEATTQYEAEHEIDLIGINNDDHVDALINEVDVVMDKLSTDTETSSMPLPYSKETTFTVNHVTQSTVFDQEKYTSPWENDNDSSNRTINRLKTSTVVPLELTGNQVINVTGNYNEIEQFSKLMENKSKNIENMSGIVTDTSKKISSVSEIDKSTEQTADLIPTTTESSVTSEYQNTRIVSKTKSAVSVNKSKKTIIKHLQVLRTKPKASIVKFIRNVPYANGANTDSITLKVSNPKQGKNENLVTGINKNTYTSESQSLRAMSNKVFGKAVDLMIDNYDKISGNGFESTTASLKQMSDSVSKSLHGSRLTILSNTIDKTQPSSDTWDLAKGQNATPESSHDTIPPIIVVNDNDVKLSDNNKRPRKLNTSFTHPYGASNELLAKDKKGSLSRDTGKVLASAFDTQLSSIKKKVAPVSSLSENSLSTKQDVRYSLSSKNPLVEWLAQKAKHSEAESKISKQNILPKMLQTNRSPHIDGHLTHLGSRKLFGARYNVSEPGFKRNSSCGKEFNKEEMMLLAANVLRLLLSNIKLQQTLQQLQQQQNNMAPTRYLLIPVGQVKGYVTGIKDKEYIISQDNTLYPTSYHGNRNAVKYRKNHKSKRFPDRTKYEPGAYMKKGSRIRRENTLGYHYKSSNTANKKRKIGMPTSSNPLDILKNIITTYHKSMDILNQGDNTLKQNSK